MKSCGISCNILNIISEEIILSCIVSTINMKGRMHLIFLIIYICLHHLPVSSGAGSIVGSAGAGSGGAGKMYEETEADRVAGRDIMIESLIMWISAGVLAIALVLGSVFFAVKVVLPYYKKGAADDKDNMNFTPAPKCEKGNMISMYTTKHCKQATKLKRGSLLFL